MRIHKEFPRQIHLYVSDSQWDALHEEATNQRIGVSSLVRDCIDQQLDPELRLKTILDNRTTPIIRLQGEIIPQLDAMELQEFHELPPEAEIEWLLAKKAQLEVPAVVTEPVGKLDELPVDKLLKEFKDRV